MVNTVLNTITAQKFKQFADAIEGGASASSVAGDALNKSWKVIFNGDNYDEANQQMLTDRGVWRIDSGVEANQQLTADKNKALFGEMNVLTAEECDARAEILHDHYTGTVEMEALSLIDMLNQNIIPSVKEAGVGDLAGLEAAVGTLKDAVKGIHAADTSYEKAQLSRVLRLETMIDIREVCDAAEEVVPADLWTLATYKELMFLDQTDEGGIAY
jgi:glutamine synthetase